MVLGSQYHWWRRVVRHAEFMQDNYITLYTPDQRKFVFIYKQTRDRCENVDTGDTTVSINTVAG